LYIREDCRGSFVRDIPTEGDAKAPYVTWVAVNGSDVLAYYSPDKERAQTEHVQQVAALNARVGGSIACLPSGESVIRSPEGWFITDDENKEGRSG
jgi:hypothetical protein